MNSKIAYAMLVLAAIAVSLSACVGVVEQPRREVVVVDSHKGGPPPWAPAHGYRRKHEYHYYPAIQVYYYPTVQKYYWLESGDWKIGVRLPTRFVLDDTKRVVIELDDEPHKHHVKIKGDYPPDYFEKGKGKGKAKGRS